MHPGLEDLLAFRDGEATGEVTAHVNACAACRNEVARLTETKRELQALPQLEPERDLCAATLETASRQRVNRRLAAAGWAAACLTLAFTMTTAVRGGIEAYREARITRETRSLIAESQRLEHELGTVGADRGLVFGRTAGTVADIEDRITAVDARLASIGQGRPSPEAVQLWQERVHLLGALADVQATRTSYVGL
jgi:predicted anti-sigma-YlaC factor YlaD